MFFLGIPFFEGRNSYFFGHVLSRMIDPYPVRPTFCFHMCVPRYLPIIFHFSGLTPDTRFITELTAQVFPSNRSLMVPSFDRVVARFLVTCLPTEVAVGVSMHQFTPLAAADITPSAFKESESMWVCNRHFFLFCLHHFR